MPVPSLLTLLRRKHPAEWVLLLVLLVAGGVAGRFLSKSTIWADIRYQIYQKTLTLGRPTRYPQRTAAVLLEDADYWSEVMQGRTPTRRDYLAKLITQLDEANVGVIALDFDLRSPFSNGPAEDFSVYKPENDLLFASIRNACSHHRQIVLAASITSTSDDYKLLPSIYDVAGLDPACVKTGYIQLPYDMRRIPGVLDLESGAQLNSFALAIVQTMDPIGYSRVVDNRYTAFPFSRFLSEDAF